MNFAVRMSDSLGMSLKEYSKQDKVSINQFILTAVAEKLSALKTEDMLASMAQKGSRQHALSILKRVSTTSQPLEFDRA
jgi:hypothetical protein